MNKIILAPLRCHSTGRIIYIYNEYLEMFAANNLDIITITPSSDETLEFLVEQCHGLLLTGGLDVDPVYYHEKIAENTVTELAKIEALEFKLIKMFEERNKPILGICRGIQTINVAFGGTLIQDLPHPNHHLQEDNEGYQHLVTTYKGTLLNKYTGKEFMTNSFHHQAINKVAPGFIVSARADDNVIEAIEKGNIIAVQWHPEKNNDQVQIGILKLFKDLLEVK